MTARRGADRIRRATTNTTARRSGYSLLELLIVIGVLSLMAGLTLPALRAPLDRSRLRGAAQQVEGAIAKARSLAIRSGHDHWLTWELSGREWRIETDASQPDTTDPLIEPAEGAVERTVLVRSGMLPDSVTFAEPPPRKQSVPGFLDEPAADDRSLEILEDGMLNGSASRWSEPIRFYANGRAARSATVEISGTRDLVVSVALRRLTGGTRVTFARRAGPGVTQSDAAGDDSGAAP